MKIQTKIIINKINFNMSKKLMKIIIKKFNLKKKQKKKKPKKVDKNVFLAITNRQQNQQIHFKLKSLKKIKKYVNNNF